MDESVPSTILQKRIEKKVFLSGYPLQAPIICHCCFKTQNTYNAWLSLNLHTDGAMANEVSKPRTVRDVGAFNTEIPKHRSAAVARALQSFSPSSVKREKEAVSFHRANTNSLRFLRLGPSPLFDIEMPFLFLK